VGHVGAGRRAFVALAPFFNRRLRASDWQLGGIALVRFSMALGHRARSNFGTWHLWFVWLSLSFVLGISHSASGSSQFGELFVAFVDCGLGAFVSQK
jgi:hypothetical protein